MELELGDDRNGQYFSPYHLQSLMAKLLIPDVEQTIRREGFVTVSDPASGVAGMIVAYAEYLLEAGYNPSEHMFGSCIDIDPIAADMAFIQLSLLVIPAEVVTGNTLHSQCSLTGLGIRRCTTSITLRSAWTISAMREFMRAMNKTASLS